MSDSASLWERSRQAAYAEITAVAMRLFLEQGFEQTTIDQIAATAGISRRSFFRYFGTKEDVVLGDLARDGERVREALAAVPLTTGPPPPTLGSARPRFDTQRVSPSGRMIRNSHS